MYGCFVRIFKIGKNARRAAILWMNWKVPGSNKKGVMSVLMVPSRWNCPEKSTNSLKVLPEVVVSPQKKCWMKWLSRRTWILWQMSSIRPGVKDGRVPDYQFCSVLNKCIRPLPVRDTKIIHWAWVDNPGWESPVFTLFTKGEAYHSVSLNSSFQ